MSEIKTNKVSPVGANGTVTLGDSGDTITIPSGATLTNNGTMTNSGTATGFGKVLQVQYLNWNTNSSYLSGSFLATGLTKSITPTSSSSKIIVSVNTNASNSDGNPPHWIMYRDGSVAADLIGTGATGSQTDGSFASSAALSYWPMTVFFQGVDSPATTSSVTYTMYIWGYSGTTYVNRPHATTDAHYITYTPSSIILTEVSTG
jgi:hypothetical protein